MIKSRIWATSFLFLKQNFKILILIYVGLYLFLGLGLSFYSITSSYSAKQVPLEKYVQKHQDELKTVVFQKLFSEAKLCSELKSNELKQKCQQNISYQLAIVIKEEELLEPSGFGWPNDLFFVKQSNNSFYRLGWEGKFEDISHFENKPFPKSVPYILKLVTKHCQDFEPTLQYLSDCQTYVSIDLDSKEKGYIVRRIPLTEDDSPLFIFIVPPIVLLGLIESILRGDFNEIFVSVLLIIKYLFLPFAVAVLLTVVYRKRRKHH